MRIHYDVDIEGTSDKKIDAEEIARVIEDALLELDYDPTAIVDGPDIEGDF